MLPLLGRQVDAEDTVDPRRLRLASDPQVGGDLALLPPVPVEVEAGADEVQGPPVRYQ